MNVKKAKALRKELGFKSKDPREYIKDPETKQVRLVEGSLRKTYQLVKKGIIQ